MDMFCSGRSLWQSTGGTLDTGTGTASRTRLFCCPGLAGERACSDRTSAMGSFWAITVTCAQCSRRRRRRSSRGRGQGQTALQPWTWTRTWIWTGRIRRGLGWRTRGYDTIRYDDPAGNGTRRGWTDAEGATRTRSGDASVHMLGLAGAQAVVSAGGVGELGVPVAAGAGPRSRPLA